ncbi:putative RNA-binding protein [Clavispora lusitaniae]|uniref:RNA-binding protein n=1 Tax=Clavispora lusitaniae TaxID=36911 RepID=A0AA91PZD0_CLALS|nr:putative RNA-binding protein [Clavispora lusitaniae]
MLPSNNGSVQALDQQASSAHNQIGNEMSFESQLTELEREAAMLRDISSQLDDISNSTMNKVSTSDVDSRSVYIGNLHRDVTALELALRFSSNEDVVRVTILSDKTTGLPSGYAYLEFSSVEGASQAMARMDGTPLRGRKLKVRWKRTNIFGYNILRRGRNGRLVRGVGRFGYRRFGRFQGKQGASIPR